MNIVKEIEGDNDDEPREESSIGRGKDRYEYEEGTDEFTDNKGIEQAEVSVYEDITFWPRTFSWQLLVDLVTLGPKKFQNNDELFAPTVKPGENSLRVML